MTQDEFDAFALALQGEAFAILHNKGRDYARGGNALHNFETTAEFLGMRREEVLAAHLYKHFAAIFAFIREGQTETEPIRGRIIDAQNYLTFLAAMADEDKSVDLAPGRDVDDSFRVEYARFRKINSNERTNA